MKPMQLPLLLCCMLRKLQMQFGRIQFNSVALFEVVAVTYINIILKELKAQMSLVNVLVKKANCGSCTLASYGRRRRTIDRSKEF